jgi:PAS domain S-box-containing protein
MESFACNFRRQAQDICMSNFLQGQMDYIFFCYGLAFMGLAAVSFFLAKEPEQRLPWIWVALFGLCHGLSEWLDLVALNFDNGVWFSGIRFAFMAASFLFLVEFARLGRLRRGGKVPGRWLLGVLALTAGLGALYGWNGLNASSRYALGVVGGLGAAWVLLAEARRVEAKCRPWLAAAGLGFLLYALAGGLVVPPAPFWPASSINYETFTRLTGLPVQLVRGLLALGLAFTMVGYFQVSWPAATARSHQYRARYIYTLVAALAVILILGWFWTDFLGNLAQEQLRKESLSQSNLASERLADDLETGEEAVQSLVLSPWIGPALEAKSPETIARANTVLDRYQTLFGAAAAYLLDRQGTTIASSNRNESKSFVGQSYAFRPYFKQAMAGKIGRYFALGVTSKKRGFYAAYPVKDKHGTIIGVAVLKMTLDKFQRSLGDLHPAFLTDPQEIVFIASRPDLDYHRLVPISDIKSADYLRQYGTDRFSPIFSQKVTDGTEVNFYGRRYFFFRHNVNAVMAPGWTLVNLRSVSQLVFYRSLGIASVCVLVILILGFGGSNLNIREWAHRVMASEARFRAIFTSAPEAVFVYDRETRRILDANPFMAQWLGYLPEELVNLEIEKVLAPDGPETRENPLLKDAKAPEVTAVSRYRQKDGSVVDVECIGAEILYGDKVRELIFVRDVTVRKRALEALLDSERRLAEIIDFLPDATFAIDIKGTVLTWNRAIEEMTGVEAEAMVGKGNYEYALPFYGTRRPILIDLVFMSDAEIEKKYYFVNREGDSLLAEAEVPVRGKIRQLWGKARPLYNSEGQIVGAIEAIRDITEQKEAEEALRQSEARFRQVVEASPLPIGIALENGGIEYVNPKFVETFGYTLEDIPRMEDCYRLIYPDPAYRQLVMEQWQMEAEKAAQENRTSKILEVEMTCKDGSKRIMDFFGASMGNKNLAILNDQTERKRAEAERAKLEAQMQEVQKLESLGVLAGGIAHDFNNMLMAILGNADLALLSLPPASPARPNVEEIARASQRAADLCRQMLAYSGKGRFMVARYDLTETVREMVQMLEVSVSKKATLRYSFSEELPPVEADASQLSQVIMNLITNASEALGHESGVISISTGVMECDRAYLSQTLLGDTLPEGRYVFLEVSDTGVGMHAETQRRIFDPFFTTKFTGRGLGLAAVLGIVRGHLGTIRVYSEPGRGTTFRILLPAMAWTPDDRASSTVQSPPRRRGGTVLLIDDDPSVRLVGSQMLTRLGFQVLTAAQGREGLEIFQEQGSGIDCVILDLTMPEMGGEEVFRELRRLRHDVCVILSSGYDEQEVIQHFTVEGLAGFVQKPYTVAKLQETLNRVLEPN